MMVARLFDRIRHWTVWPMLWKEFLQLRRDRLTFAMMTGLPAVQLLLFGYAIQTDVRKLPTVVVDESRSSESRQLVQVLANTDNFRIITSVPDRHVARRWIERGDARVALVIPPDYQRNLRSGKTGSRSCSSTPPIHSHRVRRSPVRNSLPRHGAPSFWRRATSCSRLSRSACVPGTIPRRRVRCSSCRASWECYSPSP